MAAKDYKICCAMFNAYIAKTSKKNPNLMLEDRREIDEGEIMQLIDWWLHQKLNGKYTNIQTITANGEPIIELKLLKK